MTAASLRVGSMFSGVGGLDMAVHALLPGSTPAWFFEWEDAPSAVLAARFPDVPNFRDVTSWDQHDLGHIDVLCGGFPCQDISTAGRQAGLKEGTRSGLWYRMADAIGALRPGLVLLENVAAITSNGGAAVVGSLADLGYDARWTVVRASDVGAAHRRARWFLAAYPHGTGRPGWAGNGDPQSGPSPHARHVAEGVARPDATDDGRLTLLPTPRTSDTNGPGVHGDGGLDLRTAVHLLPTPRATDGPHGGPNQTGDSLQPTIRALLPTPKASDEASWRRNPDATGQAASSLSSMARQGRLVDWAEYAPAIARWEAIFGRPAPAPTDDAGRLSPQFDEWLMGWPDGWTDTVYTTAKGKTRPTSRAERLKMCGNGVVPQQALAAYRHLLSVPDFVAAAV